MENAEQYRDAIKVTGPIDGASLYRNVRAARNSTEEEPFSLYTADDPALRNLYFKYSRRHHMHKLPSSLVWDHKKFGIVGEIFGEQNLKNLEAKQNDLGFIV